MRSVFVLMVFLPALCAGQTITGFSGGSFDDGSSVQVDGSGFGTKPSAAPDILENVEDVSAYAGLSHGDGIPVVADGDCPTCPWGAYYNYGERPTYYDSTNNRVAGGAYYRVHYDGNFINRNITESPDGNYYVSWWFWSNYSTYSPGAPHGVTFNKLIRYASPSQVYDGLEVQWHADAANPSGCYPAGQSFVNYSGGMVAGQWNHIEIEYYNDVSGSTFKVWRNGVMTGPSSNPYCTQDIRRIARWGSDIGTNDYPSDMEIIFGELYADNTVARVMIGDNSTFSACTHKEIQYPTSWSSTAIGITVNTGTFSTDDLAYLFVVDSSGAVSSGYPITIGEAGGAPGPTALTAPTNLQVNGGN